VAKIIRNEEEAFLKTLDRGIELFDAAAQRAIAQRSTNITAEDSFKLHDTYGFPIDLTQVMAEERGMSVDLEGYEELMEQARRRSRKTGGHVGESGEIVMVLPPDAIASLQKLGIKPTIDEDKYLARPLSVKVEAIWNGDDFDNVVGIGRTIAVITNRTNFYTEQGGQVGDRGSLYITSEAGSVGMRTVRDQVLFGSQLSGDEGSSLRGAVRVKIEDVKTCGGYVLHIGHVIDGNLNVGDRGSLKIDRDRRTPILANHTATHLLNHALREVLGEDINQKGSLVAPDRLRFDFSHPRPMTMPEIAKVEQLVNEAIHHSLRIHAETVPLELAEKIHGVRAVFGEQYPDPVRVVSIGKPIRNLISMSRNPEWKNYSIEFCGGTHLHATAEAMAFVIVQEQALAAGIRRVTALTGPAALAAREAGAELESRIIRASEMDDQTLPEECNDIAKLMDQLTISATTRHKLTGLCEELKESAKAIRKQENAAGREMVVEQARMLAENNQDPVIVHEVLGADKETLLVAMDIIRAKCPQAAAMLFTSSEVESKVVIVAGVPEILISKGLKAGDWVQQAAQICGGGGGGRPDMAQAGGKNPDKVDEAITKARAFAQQAIS
ncbi:MAG: hypothetical protein IIB54_09955, partial [Planctomycetes bacterium]|nr:hypothetical protein [Planctomycetota bacterium]